MEDFLCGIPQGLRLSSFSLTMLFGFRLFQEAVEVVHCGSIPAVIHGRVVPLPLPLKFAFVSLCCQNLTVYEPFIDMLCCFVFMYRCMLVK